MYKDLWTWSKCKDKINTLRGRLGFTDSPSLRFLKLTLSMETGQIHDEIRNKPFPEIQPSVYCILSGYAESQPAAETHKLISYSQLPGGVGYNNAFIRRGSNQSKKPSAPTLKAFGKPQRFWMLKN